jgi:hypothetical protein
MEQHCRLVPTHTTHTLARFIRDLWAKLLFNKEQQIMTKIMGISEENTVCDNCNKSGLKKTVVIDIDGVIVYYGSTCAAKAIRKSTGQKMSKGAVDSVVKMISAAQLWKRNGHSNEIVLAGIWNKFGFSGQVRNGEIEVKISTGILRI